MSNVFCPPFSTVFLVCLVKRRFEFPSFYQLKTTFCLDGPWNVSFCYLLFLALCFLRGTSCSPLSTSCSLSALPVPPQHFLLRSALPPSRSAILFCPTPHSWVGGWTRGPRVAWASLLSISGVWWPLGLGYGSKTMWGEISYSPSKYAVYFLLCSYHEI